MLTTREAAKHIGVALSTFYKRWKAWGIPVHYIDGRLKFRVRDLENWLEKRRVDPAVRETKTPLKGKR